MKWFRRCTVRKKSTRMSDDDRMVEQDSGCKTDKITMMTGEKKDKAGSGTDDA